MSAQFIAVDWGTTRLRAHLVAHGGEVLASAASDSGVQSVLPGGFPEALRHVCGAWLHAHPALPLLMAGMVGSRNGWVEAPYVPAPCGLADLARACLKLELDGHRIILAPGVDIRWTDTGAYDVMRGEEMQVLGLGLDRGLVCLPGTHCKWVLMEAGRIQAFATFITGELYAAMSNSFIARLASEPAEAEPAMLIAQASALLLGGLSRSLFQARTRVLGGDMGGAGVKPFLSALLVEDEMAGALTLFSGHAKVHLVATDPQGPIYAQALVRRGLDVEVIDPQAAFLHGLTRLLPLMV